MTTAEKEKVHDSDDLPPSNSSKKTNYAAGNQSLKTPRIMKANGEKKYLRVVLMMMLMMLTTTGIVLASIYVIITNCSPRVVFVDYTSRMMMMLVMMLQSTASFVFCCR